LRKRDLPILGSWIRLTEERKEDEQSKKGGEVCRRARNCLATQLPFIRKGRGGGRDDGRKEGRGGEKLARRSRRPYCGGETAQEALERGARWEVGNKKNNQKSTKHSPLKSPEQGGVESPASLKRKGGADGR